MRKCRVNQQNQDDKRREIFAHQGTQFVGHDVNYMVLGKLGIKIHKISACQTRGRSARSAAIVLLQCTKIGRAMRGSSQISVQAFWTVASRKVDARQVTDFGTAHHEFRTATHADWARGGSRILEGECTQIGCGAGHAFQLVNKRSAPLVADRCQWALGLVHERETRQDEEQYSARQVEIEFRVGSRRGR